MSDTDEPPGARRGGYTARVSEPRDPPDVTELLEQLAAGEPGASERVLEAMHGELHRMAQRLMADQRRSHTLQATALLNEAWMRLATAQAQKYEGQRHFLRAATRTMRNVLVDHARRRNAKKRQGGKARALLDDGIGSAEAHPDEFLALDESLTRLGERDEELLRVVELRFFGGLTAAEAGAAMGLTERQVHKRWASAREWLRRELSTNDTT